MRNITFSQNTDLLRSWVGQLWPHVASCLFFVFVFLIVLWNAVMLIYLYTVYDCFHSTKAELSNCEGDRTVCKA